MKMWRGFFCGATSLVLLLSLTTVTPARAQEADNPTTILLILDSSGSMWGQIDGVAKIQIAKQTLSTIITDLPDNAEVGLILYGHRSKGDCNDVELVTPIGLIDKSSLAQRIEAINPKGKTPITLSIQMAGEALRTIEGAATVVLVSDGEETCDADPCAATRQLKESGIDFVMHVIGFDVGDEETAQLECIASAGGGKYFTAASSEDFEFAAKTATMAVAEAPASGEGKVWIEDPKVFASGTKFTVRFEAAKTFHDNAWLGVVPSDVPHGSEMVNDQHNLGYRYIRGRTSGEDVLTAPSQPGDYDVRLHDSDSNGREVASATFTVETASGKVWLDKSEFTSAENMVVHYSAPVLGDNAWAGIIPSDIPHGSEAENDRHDVSYKYVKSDPDGTVTLTAPSTVGSYDVRLHDTNNDGSEIASVTFNVVKASGKVWLDATDYLGGQQIDVHFSSPSALGNTAWLAIVPSDVPHGSASENDRHDVDYKYVKGQTSGTVNLAAPFIAGTWDVRLNDSTASDGNELAHTVFTVSIAKGTLTLDQTSFSPGDVVAVSFEVPEGLGSRAWAGLIPSSVEHGSAATNDRHDLQYHYLSGKSSGTLQFKAPDTPGSYDIRLHDGTGKANEIASLTFMVGS
jgi:hypothetical protein